MTISEALQSAAEQLTSIEDGSLVARLLMAKVLNVQITYIFGYANSTLSSNEYAVFDQLVSRAKNHEPLAYLLGHKEFYGLDFTVTPDTLIPRPETESLVDLVIRHLTAKRSPLNATIVDVGTGSGCIAIALAKHFPQATIYAIDTSLEALKVARINADKHKATNVTFLTGSLLEPLQALLEPKSVDIVVANLPYISDAEFDQLPQNVHDFEPSSALRSGADPDVLNRQLVAQSKKWLKPGGLLAYETTNGQIVTP